MFSRNDSEMLACFICFFDAVADGKVLIESKWSWNDAVGVSDDFFDGSVVRCNNLMISICNRYLFKLLY